MACNEEYPCPNSLAWLTSQKFLSLWDVNGVGPSTGLPARTQQGDLNLLREASHGDTDHIVLIPGTVEECFEFGWRAFDYAEHFKL